MKQKLMMMSTAMLLLAGMVTGFCAEQPAEPRYGDPVIPAFDDPKYSRDYYAPPPDWVPVNSILHYTRNTRVPEVVWVKHQGSYGPGLRISIISEERLKQSVKFVGTRIPRGEQWKWDAGREARIGNRTVIVDKLNVENDFTALVFKVKANVKNASANLVIHGQGIPQFKTAECKNVRTEENGVKVYTFPITPNKAMQKLYNLQITVDPISGDGKDVVQDITIFDLHFKRAKAHCDIKQIEPRKFVKDSDGSEVKDIYEYITAADADSKALPIKGWQIAKTVVSALKTQGGQILPGANATKDNPGEQVKVPMEDTGVKIENAVEKINGKDHDVLRITWTKPTRAKQNVARVLIPFKNNALEYNTLSFLYKIEMSDGLLSCENVKLSRIPQYFYFDKYLDNPGISFASEGDRANWNVWGVTRSHLSQGKRASAKVPEGWKFFAFDMYNDDPTGNKGFTFDKITSYEITLKNGRLPEGKKVVFTIAMPKVTKGLMYAGGDMNLYKKFMAWKKNHKPLSYKEAVSMERPFDKGKLAQPLPIMKDRFVDMEIIYTFDMTYNRSSRAFAAETLKKYISRALNPLNEIPILASKPSAKDNVKIFLGLPGKLDADLKKEALAKQKQVGNTPGYYVINRGKNIYICGGDLDRVKGDKGVMNGVLDFLEYNFGVMFPRWINTKKPADNMQIEVLLPKNFTEDFSLTWGNDYINIPALKWWGFSNGNEEYAYRNRASYHGCWYKDIAHKYSSYLSMSANHWFGYGHNNNKDFWGTNAKGEKYMPGCYTGSPCLVNIIESGKDEFFTSKLTSVNGLNTNVRGEITNKNQLYINDDSVALWIEDTWNTCQCKECLSPFRLPDGTLIKKDDPDFQGEWHMVQAIAYNQMVRVYANRNMELNYLIYFFTIPVPRTPMTRYIRAHFCPYVRCDYDRPIYAPVNDKFWRIITQWGNIARTFGVSDYYLGGHFRPTADVQSFDINAMRKVGVVWFGQETESNNGSFGETWVAQRMIWEPTWNPDALRAYYSSKVYGKAAEDVYTFYAKLRALRYGENRDVDFEDWAELGHLALNTPASKGGLFSKKYANLAEELTALIEGAVEKADDPISKQYVIFVRDYWKQYLEKAKKPI